LAELWLQRTPLLATDALTSILLMRTPPSLAKELLKPDPFTKAPCATDAIILERIKNEFQHVAGASDQKSLSSFGLLIRSAVCIGYMRMPGVVAAYAHRGYMSQSLSLTQMQRISDKEWLFGLPIRSHGNAVVDSGTISDSFETPPLPDWGNAICNALDVEDSAQAIERLKGLSTSIIAVPLAKRIVDYAQRVILVPAIVRGPETLKKFARGTVTLASFMSAEWAEKRSCRSLR